VRRSDYAPGMDSHVVLLYGGSMLLALVAGSLAGCPGLRVARAATWAEASRLLAECSPEALIFDLTDACESHILPLLLTDPGLLLIGLDTEHNQAVLLKGQQAQSLTLDQIREIVVR
jgi:hypothetical protein